MKRIPPALALVAGLVACGEAPTAPSEPDPATPTVARIEVTSPVGDAVAVGVTTTLEATATATDGSTVRPTITWSTADEAVATVSSTGTVVGEAAGSTTITASVATVRADFELTVVDADVDGMRSMLADPLIVSLLPLVGGTNDGALGEEWSRCAQRLDAGALRPLQSCIADARAAMATDTEPARGPLRALVALFLDAVERLLKLS